MLHIVKTISALEDVMRVLRDEDSLLLVEQAVFAANPQHKAYRQIQGFEISVLTADAKARAIDNRISPSVTFVDFAGFVELTEKHANSTTWE
ncbi:sulfurtransferase complex subunit TusB [Vibrio sinaloensis]|uniref:sulfurtransferase complex subunit TusB n=1 Tax=Photobacterium sp. (strain ATCC 43367) TaxID=379097 RepID=UPI0035E51E94